VPATTAPVPIPTSRVGAGAVPARTDLLKLQELARLGYYRGIVNQLDAMVAAQPAVQTFVHPLMEMARQFQFETMLGHLQRELDADHAC
jgi:hypothetical protein